MKYSRLLDILQKSLPEQLDQDVTIHLADTDEYHGIFCILAATELNEVLDSHHLYLEIR